MFSCYRSEDKNLLNLFCSWDKFRLLGNGFKSQVFAGYAPSLIRKGLILYIPINEYQSIQLGKCYGRCSIH